jgi:hypothetical protein
VTPVEKLRAAWPGSGLHHARYDSHAADLERRLLELPVSAGVVYPIRSADRRLWMVRRLAVSYFHVVDEAGRGFEADARNAASVMEAQG